MAEIVRPCVAAVKKAAQSAKEAALEQAAYVSIYPDSGVSKATHFVRAVVDPAGAAAPAAHALATVHWPSALALALALALAKRVTPNT